MHRAGYITFKQDGKPFFPFIITGQRAATGTACAVGMKPDAPTGPERCMNNVGKYGRDPLGSHGNTPFRYRVFVPIIPHERFLISALFLLQVRINPKTITIF